MIIVFLLRLKGAVSSSSSVKVLEENKELCCNMSALSSVV